MAERRPTVRVWPWGLGLGVWWYVWGAKGFWWGVLYGMCWPAWVGFHLGQMLLK